MVDKQPAGVYNIPCQQRTARLTQPNIGDLHSGSAVDSDSTCGSSILSSPTRKPQPQPAAVFSGHSAVGSAPRSGRGGRWFKSRCSDQKKQTHIRVSAFLFGSERRDLNRAAARSAVSNQPSGLLLSPRVSPGRNVYPGRSCYTSVYWSFLFAAGFEQGGGTECG